MSNVIVFMSDEHSPRYSSPYGHPFVETPNMQRLADAGTVFENAYCPSPLCVPSRSAFLTGKRAHAVQAYGNTRDCIPAETDGLGAVLDRQGVYTVFVGKVHAYRPVAELAFSETLRANDGAFFFDPAQERSPLAVREGSAKRLGQYGPLDAPWGSDVDYMDAAVDWLRNRAGTINRPWVLFVNLLKPHFPHFCTEVLWDRYRDHDDLPDHGVEAATAQHPSAADLRTHFELQDVPEEHVRGLRRGYYACVTFIDLQLGRLMSALEAAGLADTTNLVYTSDHGEMLGKFGLWWKCNLLEDAARVPCIAAGPDFSAGRIRTPVDLHDLQASVFALTGAARPSRWHGAPLPTIAADDPQRVVFSEYHGHGARAGSFMVRRGNWKLIHHLAAPDQLFDLDADPEELENRAATHPRVLSAMSRELAAICDPATVQRQAETFWRKQVAANRRA